MQYQPVVDVRDGQLVGSEALLRWRGGHELPDTATAIALAEQVGLIGRIGRFVLDEVTSQAATFRTPDGSVLPLAVNLGPQQFDRPLVGHVERAASTAGLPLACRTLELTERTVMSQPGARSRCCGRSGRWGCGLRWTISASGTARSLRCVTCPWTCWRSTPALSRDSPGRTPTTDSWGPSSRWLRSSAWTSWPGASSGPTSATGCWRSVANAGRVFVFSSARTATALRAQAAGSADLPLPGLG